MTHHAVAAGSGDHCGSGGGAAVSTDLPRIALIGSPNAGKTTIFNALTGLRARTGNYPGVTVARSVGVTKLPATDDGPAGRLAIEDLPGSYSLHPVSPDEEVVSDLLAGRLPGIGRPDALIVVTDATTLQRSLSLIAQALSVGLPTALVLTMLDEMQLRGGTIDPDAFSRALGVPVVGVVANHLGTHGRGRGLDDLRALCASRASWRTVAVPPPTESPELDAWISSVLRAAGYRAPQPDARTRRIDSVLLHPGWGMVSFFAVMFLFFQVVFTVAAPLQGTVESFFGWLGVLADEHISNELLSGLIGSGIIGGVGAVLVFIPQIVLLFLVIALLENIGYMARAAFLMDRVMARTGLEGRAFVAMLSSFACAVPGIMATRTIPSSRDRLATILTAPLMTCSARLPVYVLLVGLLVDPGTRWGPIGVQGLVMFGLYLLGGVSALAAAAFFASTMLRGDLLPFYLELPPYRFPSLRTAVLTMWDSAKVFLRKAGTIILITSIAMWFLLNLPMRPEQTADLPPAQATAYVMEHSYAAAAGHAIEPIFAPLGFDWHIDIALIGALSAREVFVATLGQVAAADEPGNPTQALQAMTFTDGPHVGEPLFTAPTTIALLVWFVYALQCMSTIAAMRRETNSWRWPAFAFAYLFALGWVLAFVARWLTIWIMG